jgi:hypothetical protein
MKILRSPGYAQDSVWYAQQSFYLPCCSIGSVRLAKQITIKQDFHLFIEELLGDGTPWNLTHRSVI